MSAKVIGNPNVRTVSAQKMKVGQIGIITKDSNSNDVAVEMYDGYIILRTFSGFVALNHPSATWHSCCLPVVIQPVGTVVEYTCEV